MDGDTIGAEESYKVAGEEETRDALGMSKDEFEGWKYGEGLMFSSPSASDVLVRVHGQNVHHHAVHYTENFFKTAKLNKDGSIETTPSVTGYVDCMKFFDISPMRKAIREHHFEDKYSEDKNPGVFPFSSNLVIDCVNEFGQAMRTTFMNGRFTKMESNITLDDIILVDRYHFEADDIVIETFRQGENGWEVAASSKTSEEGVRIG